ncbi:MAG: TIGR02266 family protein [Deltaproteobacteria bacterium]|nr:TIGR02266 family protein [Deltaproteobacteria bacterium]
MSRNSAAVALPPQNPEDLRTAPRVDAEIDVTFESEHNFFTGFSENISEGGLFLATYHAHRPGEKLTLKFTLPGVEKPIETVAEVRWQRPNTHSDDTPPGVGVRFVTLSDDDRKAIERFVRHRDPLFYDE